jgi:hypothetical protein
MNKSHSGWGRMTDLENLDEFLGKLHQASNMYRSWNCPED